MIVTGLVEKRNLYQALCDAIVSSGSNWTQISSNPTEDWQDLGSDGKIFKSPPIGVNNQSVIFRMKQYVNEWGEQVGSPYLRLHIGLMKDYIPGAPGSNGTMVGATPKGIHYGLYAYEVNTPSELFKYYVLIEDHRIIIMYHKDIYRKAETQTIYIGYPELNSNIEIPGITNNIFVTGANDKYGNTSINGYWIVTQLNAGAGPSALYTTQNKAQTNYWGSVIAYNPIADSFNLYPALFETPNYNWGTPFLGYMDGVYVIPNVNASYLKDRDIINDGVNDYLIIGNSYGFYCAHVQAVKLK